MVEIHFILYRRLLKKEVEETMKLKKYKLIARAYEKRKCLDSEGLNSDGALSIDIRRSHQDPVGKSSSLHTEYRRRQNFTPPSQRVLYFRFGLRP